MSVFRMMTFVGTVVGGFVTSAVCCQADEHPAIANWHKLEQELVALTKDNEADSSPWQLKYLSRSRNVRAIRDNGGPQLWLEMAGQSELTLTPLVGFQCLEKRQDDLAFLAALQICLHLPADSSLEPYMAVREYLNNVKSTKRMRDSFSRVLLVPPSKRHRLFLLLDELPTQFLKDWFVDHNRSAALPSNEAMVLEAILARVDANDELFASDAFRDSMSNFAVLPGIPRLVFAHYSRSKDTDLLKLAVVQVLDDSTLSNGEIAGMVIARKDLIRNLDLALLNLPSSRKTFVLSLIQ